MSAPSLTLHAQPSSTADGAPEVRLQIDYGDMLSRVTLTPEETYAYAAAMVEAADRACATAAQRHQAVRP